MFLPFASRSTSAFALFRVFGGQLVDSTWKRSFAECKTLPLQPPSLLWGHLFLSVLGITSITSPCASWMAVFYRGTPDEVNEFMGRWIATSGRDGVMTR